MREFKTCPNPNCQHENRPVARFCSKCGQPLADRLVESSPAPRPQIEAMHWRRRPGEIAARVEKSDMLESASSTLVVEEGTLAVLLRDGKIVGEQGPGTYQLQNGGNRGWWGPQTEMTAILIDSGEISLEFALNELWTIDPLRLNATCLLALRVGHPQPFIVNVLKTQPTYTVVDLRQHIFPELRDAAQSYVGSHSLEQLEAERSNRRDDFAVDVQERLRPLFAQSGIVFERVQMFDLRHPHIDRVRGKEEELFLGPVELDLDKRLTTEREQAEQRKRELEAQAASQTAESASKIARQIAQTADEIARIERAREQEENDADLALAAKAMAMLKENQAAKQKLARDDEEEKRRIVREDELRRQEAAVALEQARHAMTLAREEQKQQHELSRMKTMNELSIEALIAMSDVQQGQILAELKRTEQFKGMSEDHLLILVAERNPEVARALQIKLQAVADGSVQAAEAAKWQLLAEERTKYEAELRRQMEMQQAAQLKSAQESAVRESQTLRDAADRAERMAQAAAERQERSNSEALRIVGDVAKTYAQYSPQPLSPQPSGPTMIWTPGMPAVAGPPPAVAGSVTGTASTEVQVCPKCRVKMPVGEKFCSNCGHQFFA
jgi:membrane protease subunit (stomatin/prohibitin family)